MVDLIAYVDDPKNCPILSLICTALVFLILLLIIPATVTYQKNGSPLSLDLSPGDTRIVSRPSSVCQGAALSSISPLATVNATLYFLLNAPNLGAMNNFVLANQVIDVSGGLINKWIFHLHPGSEYSLTACLLFGSVVEYYVIKGTSNYDIWLDDDELDPGEILNNPCDTSSMTDSLKISSEDDYYFIFYNRKIASSSRVQVTFSFNRTEYLPESGDIVSNCTATAISGCSLDIPYNSDYTVLVQVDPPSDGDWDAKVGVTVSCESRAWVYAVIEISMVAVVVVGAIAVRACGRFLYRIKKGPRRNTTPIARGQPVPTTNTRRPAQAPEVQSADVLATTRLVGVKDATSTSVLTPPPPPDYADGILARPLPLDDKDAPPPDYKDEPPPPPY